MAIPLLRVSYRAWRRLLTKGGARPSAALFDERHVDPGHRQPEVHALPTSVRLRTTPLSSRMVIAPAPPPMAIPAASLTYFPSRAGARPCVFTRSSFCTRYPVYFSQSRGRRSASASARKPTHRLRVPFEKPARRLDERPALASIVYRNACRYFAAHLGQMALARDRPYF
jgi:hypothetical protein